MESLPRRLCYLAGMNFEEKIKKKNFAWDKSSAVVKDN